MRRAVTVFILSALALAGVAAGVFAPGIGAAPQASAATVKITVKASEFKFVLSKRTVPAGSTVVFTVVNTGKISHDFKIAGKKIPTIGPGKTAKLTVKFAKKGHFPYLCTLLGHAGAGMKGTFSVGVAAVKPPPTTTTRTTTTTPPPPPTERRLDDGAGRHVRLSLRPLAVDDAVGPGHLRDHEQGQRGAQLLDRRWSRGDAPFTGTVRDVHRRPSRRVVQRRLRCAVPYRPRHADDDHHHAVRRPSEHVQFDEGRRKPALVIRGACHSRSVSFEERVVRGAPGGPVAIVATRP